MHIGWGVSLSMHEWTVDLFMKYVVNFCLFLSMNQCCEKLGAGEILLNCVDMDGQKDGFDLGLVKVIPYLCNSSTNRLFICSSRLLICSSRLIMCSCVGSVDLR